MKRLLPLFGWTGILLIVCMLSIALGELWFGLWMDKGWPGATGLLSKLMHADGEGAYDAMQYEMIIWCFLALAIALAYGRKFRRTWHKGH